MLSPDVLWDHVTRLHPDASVLPVEALEKSLGEAKYTVDRYAHLIPTLRKLEKAGLGQLMVGRRGRPTRMMWRGKPRELRFELKTAGSNGTSPQGPPSPEMVEYPLPLRTGVTARFTIPADLTKAEAARISTFIQGLPLSE